MIRIQRKIEIKDFWKLNNVERTKETTRNRYNQLPQEKKRLMSLKTIEWKKHSCKGKYSVYKWNAKRKNLQFSLTKPQFEDLLNSPCSYCDKEISWGIDKLISKYGYILHNCVPCCRKCNLMKNKYSVQEFKDHVEKMYNFMFA